MEFETIKKISANVSETMDQYNILQVIWDKRIGYEDTLRSPVWPVVMSVGSYFALILPFTIADVFGRGWNWIQKYKIQPEKDVTWPLVRRAVILTLWNNFVYILPTAIAQYIWTPDSPLPAKAPSMFEFLWQMTAMTVIFDFQYFIWHYMHHRYRWLYKSFHALHHEYSSPFSWVTQYLHPWELFTVGFFTTVDPWLFQCHCMTTWAWMLWNVIISIEAHLGFDFPLSLGYWLPNWGGAAKHDMHHMKPLTNFQPYLTHWDKIFGTHCPGTVAGGVKPKALLEYERKRREKRFKKEGLFTIDGIMKEEDPNSENSGIIRVN
jgi:cholesterol 25-hydroxylase